MRGHAKRIVLGLSLVALLMASGCRNGSYNRPAIAAKGEPGLADPTVSGEAIVAAPATPRTVTFVDRHPLFSKPREYYDNTQSNKAVKTAAAGVVGIPAGIYGELKQIVVGAPNSTPN